MRVAAAHYRSDTTRTKKEKKTEIGKALSEEKYVVQIFLLLIEMEFNVRIILICFRRLRLLLKEKWLGGAGRR